MGTDAYRGALEAVDRILNREPEADEVLRKTVGALHERVGHYGYVAISFVEEGELLLGPWKGSESEGDAGLDVPIAYRGAHVGTLRVAAEPGHVFAADEREFLDRVALLVSAHCLVGWDTGGVPWPEVD